MVDSIEKTQLEKFLEVIGTVNPGTDLRLVYLPMSLDRPEFALAIIDPERDFFIQPDWRDVEQVLAEAASFGIERNWPNFLAQRSSFWFKPEFNPPYYYKYDPTVVDDGSGYISLKQWVQEVQQGEEPFRWPKDWKLRIFFIIANFQKIFYHYLSYLWNSD